MRPRIWRVLIAIGVVVGINVLARVLGRFVLPATVDALLPAGLSLLCAAIAVGVFAFLWTRRFRVRPVLLDLLVVLVVSTLLVVFAAAYVTGPPTFVLGPTFAQLGLHAALLAVGAAAGLSAALAFGVDPVGRSWQSYAAGARSKGPAKGSSKGVGAAKKPTNAKGSGKKPVGAKGAGKQRR